MKQLVLALAAVLSPLLAAAAAPSGPRVTASVPPNQATDIPASLGKIIVRYDRPLAAGIEFLYWLTRRPTPPKLTRYILDSACRDLLYDCTKAEQELSWSSDQAVEFVPPGS